jgi:hypothetical protein
MKGTNASRPTTISRPGKVAWRAWPTITLRSQWSSQAIAILHLVLVAAVLCRILGRLVGGGGGGRFFPSGRLLSLMGLSTQVAPVAAQICGPRSGGLPWRRAGMGGRGAVPCVASASPPPAAVFAGSAFSCSGEACYVSPLHSTYILGTACIRSHSLLLALLHST